MPKTNIECFKKTKKKCPNWIQNSFDKMEKSKQKTNKELDIKIIFKIYLKTFKIG